MSWALTELGSRAQQLTATGSAAGNWTMKPFAAMAVMGTGSTDISTRQREAYLGDDAVEELAALAQLQDEVHIVPVLERLLQRGDILVVAHQLQHLRCLPRCLPRKARPRKCTAGCSPG